MELSPKQAAKVAKQASKVATPNTVTGITVESGKVVEEDDSGILTRLYKIIRR